MSAEQNVVVPDPWLAGILGRDVYRVAVPESVTPSATPRDLAARRQVERAQADRVFLYARAKTTDIAGATLLESLRFRLIDTNVVLARPIDPAAATPAAGTIVRAAGPDDRAAVVSLARRAFVCSRFHLDPAIPGRIADEIKARWADNWFTGRRGDAMAVAVADGAIAGFCLLLHGRDGTLMIDLIAVDPDHRGRGIAGAMIAFAQREGRGFSEIRVGTQVANLASVRCYERLGFRLQSSQYVFHYHNPPEYGE